MGLRHFDPLVRCAISITLRFRTLVESKIPYRVNLLAKEHPIENADVELLERQVSGRFRVTEASASHVGEPHEERVRPNEPVGLPISEVE